MRRSDFKRAGNYFKKPFFIKSVVRQKTVAVIKEYNIMRRYEKSWALQEIFAGREGRESEAAGSEQSTGHYSELISGDASNHKAWKTFGETLKESFTKSG